MKKLMQLLFLSCLKATELIEKKMNFKLSRKESIRLRAHKMVCDACSNYEKQSRLLEKGIAESHASTFSETDLEQLKQMIHSKLEEWKQ